jgi:hypothetical protein
MPTTWSRLRGAAVVTPVALGAALAPAAALVPAAALAAPGPAASATSAGWQIEKTFGLGTTIFSVSGVTASDAWLAGLSASGGLLVQHWNGKAWGPIATPASLNGNSVGNAVIAGAGKTVWAFDDEGNATSNAVALRRTARGWTSYQFPDDSLVNAAAVFGPTNAWAFGEIFFPEVSAYVRHFNGSKWTAVSTPVVPNDASAVSAGDIWTVGQTVKSLGSPDQVFAAAQWTRGKWRLLNFPRLRLPKGVFVTFPEVAALGSANVWVDFSLQKGMGAYPGAILLHYNGRKWTQVRVPYKSTFALTNLAADGHGGIWIAATTDSGQHQYVYHLLAGRWSREQMPSARGDETQVEAIAERPGATQAWAAGDMMPTGGGIPEGVLLDDRG